MFYLLDYFKIGVFVDVYLSPFNFANMLSKYITNLAPSNVTLTRCANAV